MERRKKPPVHTGRAAPHDGSTRITHRRRPVSDSRTVDGNRLGAVVVAPFGPCAVSTVVPPAARERATHG
ncbi:hypothetical protein GCM10010306_061110 [Streptomyces umbrinus]|nr:hypothetical protein GCM10010306_061110 [Streptomyces umbrinus]